MQSYLPFEIKYSPIQKIALISFEKCPDAIYRELQFQYVNGETYGTGYRVIAYRNDDYLDIYDDKALNFIRDEKFNVMGKGLNKHVQTEINNTLFSREDNKQTLAFEFTDVENRQIKVYIEEKSNKHTFPMNTLAPISMSAVRPNCLPVFFMYNFDFIRQNQTVIACDISGKEILLDKFPIPMFGQPRLYTRYSNDCELIEFANTDCNVLKEVELDEKNVYRDEHVEYVFEEENALQSVIVHFAKNDVQIHFTPSLDLNKDGSGEFTIQPSEEMGYLKGIFEIRTGKETRVVMEPKYGWISNPSNFFTKMILGKRSIFHKWSKQYKYESVIDWETKTITASWKNSNIEENS